MNGKLRFCMGFLRSIIVVGGILFFTLQGFAGEANYYDWKDDQGTTHFTNDLSKIPSKYRSSVNVKKMPEYPQSKSNSIPPPEAPAENLARWIKTDEEQMAMREALRFLKSDIRRFEKYEDYIGERRHYILLRGDVTESLPEKEALEEKLGNYDSALLKDISNFLKKSLQKDYEVKTREWPRRLAFMKQRDRIKEERLVKIRLVEKLQAEIKPMPEKAPEGNHGKLSVELKKTLK